MQDKSIIDILKEYCLNDDIQNLKSFLRQEKVKRTIICEFNDEDFESILFLDEKYNGTILDALSDRKGKEI